MDRVSTYEERLSDLEQIVIRQADRIAALEQQLELREAGRLVTLKKLLDRMDEKAA